MIDGFMDWFLSLGANYGVNPWNFGAINAGAILFLLAGLVVYGAVTTVFDTRRKIAAARAAGQD